MVTYRSLVHYGKGLEHYSTLMLTYRSLVHYGKGLERYSTLSRKIEFRRIALRTNRIGEFSYCLPQFRRTWQLWNKHRLVSACLNTSTEHRIMEKVNKKKRGEHGEEEEEEEDDEEAGKELEAWERAYADERSWETLQEDEEGLLNLDKKQQQQCQYRRRLQSAATAASNIQRGLIRYLYIFIDFSRAAAEKDFKPNRMVVVANCVEAFVREFFVQNPLSQLGIVIIKNGVAHRLTDLSGSPESHIKALGNNLECSGDSSLQNALDLAHGYLSQIPSYGHREVLVLYSALSTCDPGDIMESIKKCKDSKMRCSVVGLSAEIYICKHLCEETGGFYSVALDESHFKDLLLEHCPPPPAIAEFAVASLVKMGFPQRGAEGVISLCACHKEVKVGGGYTCPRCKARACELPTECHICGLTLVSSPHLARSYHHLFPVTPFEEVLRTSSNDRLPRTCFGCQQFLPNPGSKAGVRLACPKCKHHFCFDCDIYIHDSVHNCPGCESSPAITL